MGEREELIPRLESRLGAWSWFDMPAWVLEPVSEVAYISCDGQSLTLAEADIGRARHAYLRDEIGVEELEQRVGEALCQPHADVRTGVAKYLYWP